MRLASSVEGLRGVKGATATATFTYDEKVKIPLRRQGCSPNISQRPRNPEIEPHHLVGFTPEVT